MRSRVRIGLLYLFVAFIGHTAARAQNYHVVYVEDFATCNNTPCGTEAEPWSTPDGTAGITTALASCFSPLGNNTDGCVVVLPKGYVKISSTIELGTSGQRREGLILRGHGSGEKSTSSTSSLAGTTLVWAGSSGGTVLRVASTSWSRLEDFAIDGGGSGVGNGTAGIGIDVTANNSVSPSQQDMFKNIYISSINGSPGIGIRVAPNPLSSQTSEMTFEDINITYVTTGVVQDGGQTANVHWIRTYVLGFKDYGMDFKNGIIYTDSCMFIPDPDWDPSIADVYVESAAGWTIFQNNYHETKSGVSYKFQTSTSRVDPTTFINTRVLWFMAGGNIVDYQNVGPVNFYGCTFHLNNPATNYGVVSINAPTGAATATVTSYGNFYSWGSVNSGVVMQVQGNASLVSNDSPSKTNGTPSNSNVAHEFYKAGLVFEHGSFNWKNTGESIKFKQELNGDLLRMMDGSGNTFSWWSNTGILHFQKSTSAIEFEGSTDDNNDTALVAANATAPRTITLPDLSGTLVTDTGSQSVSSKNLTASTNVFPALGLLSFQGSLTANGYLGAGGAVNATESNVQTFVPAMTVKSIQCFTPTSLTGGKSWAIYVRRGTSSPTDVIGPCTLDSTHATCTATGSAAYNGSSDRLSLRVSAISSPPSSQLSCTATVGF